MDVKLAVEKAKAFVIELFANEQIRNLGLEEVEFDESEHAWLITLGFTRPWDQANFASKLGMLEPRTYKIIRISEDGTVVSVKNRQPAIA